MAFKTPSIQDVWTRLRNAMRAYLPGTDAWIEPSNLSVVGRSFSLVLDEAYSRLLYLYRQLFASTADGFHLEFRHAFEYGVSRKAAAPAQGVVSFTQTGSPATIPAGWLATAPNGIVYTFLTTAVPGAGGVTTVEIRAATDGANTNQLPFTPLTLVQDAGYPSLPAECIVGAQGLGGGADVESDEDLRKRVLARKRQPPHGGSKSDYELWALEVPGVTRVFVSSFKATDPNQAHTPLTVYPMFDDTRSNGVPTAYDLSVVGQYIDQRRPVTARVYVAAPNPVPVSVRIADLRNDSAELRAAIISNLAAMFYERVPVVTGENNFTLPQAWLDEAISRCDGYVRHRIVAPEDDLSFMPGSLPILGDVSFGA
jgi:uncharacterized phage protein gp47/JayE